MKRLKSFIPYSILITLYKSLILPTFYYGLLLWGTQCERLYKLQKRIVRIITNNNFLAHSEPIFKCLHFPKLPDLYIIQLYKLYYKIKNQNVPNYLLNTLTQTNHPHNTRFCFLTYPSCRHEYARTNCIYRLVNVINHSRDHRLQIKIDMVVSHSLSVFVAHLKTQILGLYSLECTIPNCYVCHRYG